jgi:hypothetical protein
MKCYGMSDKSDMWETGVPEVFALMGHPEKVRGMKKISYRLRSVSSAIVLTEVDCVDIFRRVQLLSVQGVRRLEHVDGGSTFVN